MTQSAEKLVASDGKRAADPDEIARDLKKYLRHLKKRAIAKVESTSNLNFRNNQLELTRRAAIVRQHEALVAICDLVVAQRGHIAATLLRPACEELIAISYLKTLTPADAARLLSLMLADETYTALTVQHKYSGDELMQAWRLMRYLRALREKRPYVAQALADMGQKLGWKRVDEAKRGVHGTADEQPEAI